MLAFVELARAQHDDYDVLLNHYADPTLIATAEVCISTPAEQVVRMMRGQIEALRAAGYERTTADRLEIRTLNANAALIDAHWSRQTSDGATPVRICAYYTAVRLPVGWRIGSIIVADP